MAKLTPESLARILLDINDGGYIDVDPEFVPGGTAPYDPREIHIDGIFDVDQLIGDIELEMLDIRAGDTVKNIAHPELDWRTVVRVVDDTAITINIGGTESSPLPIDLFRVAVKRDTSSRRTLTVDLDTGEWVTGGPITGEDGARVAASVLPGMPAGLIDRAYSEWLGSEVQS